MLYNAGISKGRKFYQRPQGRDIEMVRPEKTVGKNLFRKKRRILKQRPLRVWNRVNKPTNAKKKKSKKKGGM